MTHDEMIEVIAAHRDGKTIEVQHRGRWFELTDPSWDFYEFNYRIKPEPREWFVVLDEQGEPDAWYMRKKEASEYVSYYGGHVVKVREVLDDGQ